MPRRPTRTLPPLDFHGETLGKRLARLRKGRGVTQIELARRVGIQQALVSAYETDRLRMSAEMAVRLALALNASLDDLLSPSARPRQAANTPRRLLRRLELIERLPRYRQTVLLTTIDAFLKGAGRAG